MRVKNSLYICCLRVRRYWFENTWQPMDYSQNLEEDSLFLAGNVQVGLWVDPYYNSHYWVEIDSLTLLAGAPLLCELY